jgi:LmbE family N-acetylglucosaminyl deacetylase
MKSVLMVGAHPDDETMLTGGILALLSANDVCVHILCATRGEGGELGEPPVCERVNLGAVREQELYCAADQLGATSVYLLDYVDPLVGPEEELYPFEADFDTLVGEIRRVIRQVEAEVVLAHGTDGEYGHPAHRLVHEAVKAAVEQEDGGVLFYSFAAKVPGIEDHILNDSNPAHLAVDIQPWVDAKAAAARCHVSQHALFARHHPDETFEQLVRGIEAVHRHLPPFEGDVPHDAFADLLLAAGAWVPEFS